MLRNVSMLLLIIGTAFSGYSQNTDSLTFVRAKWVTQSLGSKTKLFKHQFDAGNLFGRNQNISYVEVKNKRAAPAFAIGAELKVLKPTSEFGREAGALVAINGTFFDVKNGGSVDLIKLNGTITAQNRLDQGLTRSAHQQAAIAIAKGRLSIIKWDGSSDWESRESTENMMVTGPLLALAGKDMALDSGSFSMTRHPRTAIGLKPNGKVILLTVDGRNTNSSGMSLFELRKIMRWLGCTSAINLDGGGSTTLWVEGEGVVNYPTDNKKWDHEGERNVANVILLKKKL